MLQFISFLWVKHTECVEVLGASNLELNHVSAPLDLHRPRILPSGSEKEVLNLVNLLRLHSKYHTSINSNFKAWTVHKSKYSNRKTFTELRNLTERSLTSKHNQVPTLKLGENKTLRNPKVLNKGIVKNY